MFAGFTESKHLDEVAEKVKASTSWSTRGRGAEKLVSWDYLQIREREEGDNL